jgi:hypothetical protein
MPPLHYNWHACTKRRYWFSFAAVGLGTIIWFATRGGADWAPRIVALVLVLVSLFLLVEQDARVDPEAGMVIRMGRLFGRWLVWRWRDHLNDFTAVRLRRQHDPEGGDTILLGCGGVPGVWFRSGISSQVRASPAGRLKAPRAVSPTLRGWSCMRTRLNPAHALDGGIPCPFHIGRHWPAASDEHSWTKNRA